MRIHTLFRTMALGLLLTAAPASASIIISIDQTGANIPISATAPRVWNITLTSTGTFDSALFSAKNGGNTFASLNFTVYSGFNGTFAENAEGRLIYNSSLASTEFSKSSYQVETFSLGSLVLGPGNYSLELSSAATGGGTDQYFIKSGSNDGALTFTDSTTGLESAIVVQGTNNVTNSSTATAPAPTVTIAPVPEPSSMLLGAGVGLVCLVGAVRRRARAPQPEIQEAA